MKSTANSAMLTGLTMLTVSAVAFAPVRPTPSPTPPPAVQLAASVEPTQLPSPLRILPNPSSSPEALGPSVEAVDLPGLLVDWLERIIVPPSLGAAFPEPNFPPVIVGNSIDSVIKNVYNAIEPWVEWGFDVAAYAVGWIPYVGWLAPQISIFYDFGERIVRSITFNVADWLGGNISFWDGLVNVGIDTINSFIYLANDQLAFWLPPLPPIPPIGPRVADVAEPELTRIMSLTEGTVDGGELVDEDLGEPTEPVGSDVIDELAGGANDEVIIDDPKETTPELTVNELIDENELQEAGNPTVTNSLGTVQAQGEIRGSTFVSPTGASPNTQDTDESLDGALNQEPADPAAAPSPQAPQAPPANTDAPDTANPGDNPGNGPATE